MAESVLFTKYENTVFFNSDYISTFLYHENISLHQNYYIFVLALKDLVTEAMVGSSMQVQNKIRFLLVAGRTQEIIRVNTKSCIWLLQAITFVRSEKLSGHCYLF